MYAKDKNNKEVSTTIAYGTTGEVTLVSSCQLSETSGGNLSCAWYKLTDDAAIPPLEGATGTSYTLPADLPAGTHTYLVTFTSDYYSKSAEITITVTPISLEDATVTVSNLTYNGNPQEPTVTVKLGDETLSRDNDYTVQVTKQTDAGSYKLTIKGGGNYSGEIKDVEWKIEPMKIDSVMVSSGISKTYDGTATVTKTAEEWAKVLTFKTLSASGVVDVPSEAYTISDAYFVEKSGEETIHSPDAGEKYGITFKIALKSSNYVLQNYYDEEPAATKEITQSGGANFTITQATVTSPDEITQYVYNDLAKTYTLDLAALLPELSEGCEYGDIQYQGHNYNFTDNAYLDGNDAVSVSKEGVLTLSTVAASTAKVGDQIGTITVPVVTTNYQKFEFTIKVYISERIPLNASGVTVSASDITYGQMLNKSKLTATGTMKHPGTGEEVKGTFAWTNPEAKPGAAGDYTASWTFTPAAGYEEYAPATGTVTIKVNKATPTFTAPTAQENLTYTGQEQALITAGMTDHGTMLYSLTESGTYSQDIPTGTDAGAYTVWYRVIGDANHNDTEPASVAVRIGQKPLPPPRGTAASKTYDGTTNAGITSVTFDNVTLNRGTDYTVTASFDDAGVGNDKNVTATVTLMGQVAKNYALEQSSFLTTGSITAKQVTVSGITANGKVYDGTTDAVLDYSKVVLDGVLENDTLTVTAKGMFEKADVGEQKVTISDLTLDGNSANNYVLAESGNQTETIATITAKEVTVTPDNKSKVYQEKDPELTYIVSGVLSGETLKGITLARAEGENAGQYAITATADAGANPNYEVTFAKGTLTIEPKSIKGAKVVLGKGLTANGAEQTQTVEKVLLDDKEIPADSYTVAGNTATAPGRYTLTVTAKGNYTDSVEQIYAIAYKDTAVPSSSKPSSNNSSNDSETKKNEVAAPTPAPTPASTSKPSTITAMPQTGDTSNPTLYVVLLVASLLGLAVVFVCKKRNDK